MLPTDFRRLAACTIVVASTFSAASAADTPQLAFSRSWEGRQVKVRRTLYTLVYNERGRLGNTYSGKREGLTVLTPYDGIYFQFEGRQGRRDVVVRDPQQIIDAVAAEYQGDTLDLRSFRKVEPVLIARRRGGGTLLDTEVWFTTHRDTPPPRCDDGFGDKEFLNGYDCHEVAAPLDDLPVGASDRRRPPRLLRRPAASAKTRRLAETRRGLGAGPLGAGSMRCVGERAFKA